MRHEVPSHTVVGVVKQNSRDRFLTRVLTFIAPGGHSAASPMGFVPLISSGTLRVPGTRGIQLALSGR